MSFKILKSKIPGCFEMVFNPIKDNRGLFTKTFHRDVYLDLGINFSVAEEYYTNSINNVFRGLHFQLPPVELNKMVHCISGKVIDFVVDLRVGSPTYGEWTSFFLDSDKPSAVYIPAGLAHGFYVKSNNSIMNYKVSQVYDFRYDSGISYKSLDFSNEISNPIMSDRDLNFATFENFKSPFKFQL